MLKEKIKYHSNSGFTLMEIMIVVAILGILAAFAIPAYQRYILSTHRKAAIADMLSVQQQLERSYSINNGAYQLPIGLNATGSCTAENDNSSGSPPRYKFAIDIQQNNQFYTLTANACGAQAKDVCGNLRLDSEGLRLVDHTGSFAADGICF
ncbi:MAG: type IV pilin protein [Ostreibacterium sp.]